MPEHLNIVLIDSDQKRYAAIAEQLVRAGVKKPLRSDQNWSELEEALIMVADDEDALEEILALVKSRYALSLIVYAEQPDVKKIVDAISRGAIDYLLVPTTPTELRTSLSRARQKTVQMSQAQFRVRHAAERIARLTPRERQVLMCVARGLPNRLTGVELEISPRTVELHRAHLMAKLGAKTASEAIRIVIDAGEA